MADRRAPFRDALGRYYLTQIPATIITVPELLVDPPFASINIRWFVVKGDAPKNSQPAPLTSSVAHLAWGMRYCGKLYVKGTTLSAVLLVRQALLAP